MAKVSGTRLITQTSPHNTYNPGSSVCAPGKCTITTPRQRCASTSGVIDWNFVEQFCGDTCPSQPICSRPNPAMCPTINGTSGVISWVTPDDNAAGVVQGRRVRCSYDLSGFKTADDLQIWVDNFGQDDSYNILIMPTFCGQPSTTGTCPTGINISPSPSICPTGLTGCSRLTANSEEGSMCRAWAGTNQPTADVIQQTYCDTSKCSTDCLCYNRGVVDPTYINIMSQDTSPSPSYDACWYVPCQNDSTYLIPKGQQYDASVCPGSICTSVAGIVDSNTGGIDTKVAREIVNCRLNAPGTSADEQEQYFASVWDVSSGWILLLVVVITVLIVVAVLIIQYRSSIMSPKI
jgi:hypothetical protein